MVGLRVLLALVLAFGSTGSASPTSSQAAAGVCMPDLGTRVPIVLVHGLGSSASVWGKASDSHSMVHTLDQLAGVYVETFDYSTTNTDWVTNQNIGPRLATRIACLAGSSRKEGGAGKVILVGHSMGGLAIRYAESQTRDNIPISSETGLVVTIGTPENGSGWADLLSTWTAELCDPTMLPNRQQCSAASAIIALQNYSSQINALAPFPKNLPVMAVAGNVTVTLPLIHTKITDSGSDLVVSEKSALHGQGPAQDGGGTAVVNCSIPVTTFWDATCWHTALPHNPAVEQDTVGAVKQYLASAALARAVQPYVGTWYSADPGLTMVMNAAGAATLTWSNSTAKMQCRVASSGLDCTLNDVDAPYTGFRNGGPVSLSLAADGGVSFNPYSAADGTELYNVDSVTPYVGFWYINSGGLVVKANGSGTLQYDADSCPVAATGACTIYEDVTLKPTGPGTATVTTDSSYVSALGASGAARTNSVIPVGTTYKVTQLGGGELQIDMSSSPYPVFSGLVPLCLYGSPAQTQDVCGA